MQLAHVIDALYSGQEERLITTSGYRYLRDLLVRGDVVLEAAFERYRDSNNLDDFKDTLLHLAARWKRCALTLLDRS